MTEQVVSGTLAEVAILIVIKPEASVTVEEIKDVMAEEIKDVMEVVTMANVVILNLVMVPLEMVLVAISNQIPVNREGLALRWKNTKHILVYFCLVDVLTLLSLVAWLLVYQFMGKSAYKWNKMKRKLNTESGIHLDRNWVPQCCVKSHICP